mmetsp:Transcript_96610/g.151011  ORF Transcript_96610/g.151011 Transcript_96610/m.151011 type:complete len:201 (-) Transcript_96610:3178-3780(-)
MPFLVADFVNEICLRLNHNNASSEIRQSFGQCLDCLNIKVVCRFVYGDKMRFRPEHCRKGQSHFLSSREALDLLIATHFLIDTEGLNVSDDLATSQRTLIKTCSLGSNPLVASNYHLLQPHGFQFRNRFDCVLFWIVQASPLYFIGKLRAQLCATDKVFDFIAIFSMFFRQCYSASRFLFVFRLDKPPLQVAIKSIFETC